jgi:hypothetical protein
MNDDWIALEEGRYYAVQAYLVTADGAAVALENPHIDVVTGRFGKRYLKGGCLVQNFLMIELLEDHDELDIMLDLGGEYKYLMEKPDIQGGKVFSPQVRSSLRFSPTAPWFKMPEADFEERLSQLDVLSG